MLFIGHMLTVLAIIIKKVSLTTVVKTTKKKRKNSTRFGRFPILPVYVFSFFTSRCLCGKRPTDPLDTVASPRGRQV